MINQPGNLELALKHLRYVYNEKGKMLKSIVDIKQELVWLEEAIKSVEKLLSKEKKDGH